MSCPISICLHRQQYPSQSKEAINDLQIIQAYHTLNDPALRKAYDTANPHHGLPKADLAEACERSRPRHQPELKRELASLETARESLLAQLLADQAYLGICERALVSEWQSGYERGEEPARLAIIDERFGEAAKRLQDLEENTREVWRVREQLRVLWVVGGRQWSPKELEALRRLRR